MRRLSTFVNGHREPVELRRLSNMSDKSEIMINTGNMGDVVGEMVEAIRGIAFQTNLLAINATVEAACMGEAGEGFTALKYNASTKADRAVACANEVTRSVAELPDAIIDTDDRIGQMQNCVDRIVKTVASLGESW
ncbi:MAG: hypothetical protein GY854_28445 [Deltaproteobacteria bacterium]|nr:hypothetical protein [Deltaproteobacteria bacterium]